jgi:phage terminase large subunit GpA-like protein
MRPPHRRQKHRIDFRECSTLLAWSGSVSQLADASAWFVHVNEVDKHSLDASAEGDSVKLLKERSKEFPTRKILVEGTPTVAGHSRLEAEMASSDYRRLWVPCPLCGEYQILRMGNKNEPGGIRWDHRADGSTDSNEAYETAHYVCRHCEGKIYDEHRARMMRSGIWAPRDTVVFPDGSINGEMPRWPVAGFQLSSLYALVLGWGDIAREKVVSCIGHDTSRKRQNFTNSWEGELYKRERGVEDWRTVGKRLAGLHPQGNVPVGTVFLCAGVDVQKDHFVFMVVGYGQNAESFLVDYGICHSEDEIAAAIERQYAREDGGGSMGITLTLIDSGDRTHEVYQLTDRLHSPALNRSVMPVKGLKSGDMGGEPYRRRKITDDPKRRNENRAGLHSRVLVHHNKAYWEVVVDDILFVLSPGMAGSMTLCVEAVDDEDLIEQMLNQVEEDGKWVKVREDKADDFRAALRYVRTAAEMVVGRRWASIRYTQPQVDVVGTVEKDGQVVQVTVPKKRERPQRKQRQNPWLQRLGLK